MGDLRKVLAATEDLDDVCWTYVEFICALSHYGGGCRSGWSCNEGWMRQRLPWWRKDGIEAEALSENVDIRTCHCRNAGLTTAD